MGVRLQSWQTIRIKSDENLLRLDYQLNTGLMHGHGDAGEVYLQPLTHFPMALNSIVLPLNGTCTFILAVLINVAVRVLGMTLPFLVAASLA